jgi:hypothetical protein
MHACTGFRYLSLRGTEPSSERPCTSRKDDIVVPSRHMPLIQLQYYQRAIDRVLYSAKLCVRQDRKKRGQIMLSHDEVERIREEREAVETWRSVSRHVVADLLEMCNNCGTIREKAQLARCGWCEDTYICKDGNCAQRHQRLHSDVDF